MRHACHTTVLLMLLCTPACKRGASAPAPVNHAPEVPATGSALVDTAPPSNPNTHVDTTGTCPGTWRKEDTADHLGMAEVCVDAQGVPQGPYVARYASGKDKETGSHDQGQKDGLWTRWRVDGTKELESTWLHGAKTGRETAFDVHGERTSEGENRDGKKEGLWKQFEGRGMCVLESTYVAGIKHGRETQRYEDGSTMKDGPYKAGKRDGRWSYYGRNGRMAAQGNFTNDQESGLWKQWGEDGKRRNSLEYKNGEATVVDDLPTCPVNAIKVDHDLYGGSEQYCERTTKTQWGQVLPVREGPYTRFDANGDVVEQGKFVNGQREGKWTRQQGASSVQEVYKGGRLVTVLRP